MVISARYTSKGKSKEVFYRRINLPCSEVTCIQNVFQITPKVYCQTYFFPKLPKVVLVVKKKNPFPFNSSNINKAYYFKGVILSCIKVHHSNQSSYKYGTEQITEAYETCLKEIKENL